MTATMTTLDASEMTLRDLNQAIREVVAAGGEVTVTNPRSRHNIGVALTGGGSLRVEGSVGYYCGGLTDGASITVTGNSGWGTGESLSSGLITVEGNAGLGVGASMVGGTIHVKGNAGPRCGIAQKGGTIVVEGNIGFNSGFMGHSGRLICLGDATDSVGDSLWGGSVWVAGTIHKMGVDTKLEDPSQEELDEVEALLDDLGVEKKARNWKKIVSGQALWHFESREAKTWLMI